MTFEIINSSIDRPVKFYDGEERVEFPFELALEGKTAELQINILSPECWHWRNYFNDQELNELAGALKFSYTFNVNAERATNASINKDIYIHPFHLNDKEISVCFAYDEVSNGHYILWLIAVISRDITEEEYLSRISIIEKYHAKES